LAEFGQERPLGALIRQDLMIKMDQNPAPYLKMKEHGATAEEVYRKARLDGYKKHECLALIMGVFGLELDDARNIGHQVFYQERDALLKAGR